MNPSQLPIALVCATTASGDVLGRAVPLWTLLPPERNALSTRAHMREALQAIEGAFGPLGAPEGVAEGFTMDCEGRQTLVAHLGGARPDEAAALADLAKMDPAMQPGPTARIGKRLIDESIPLSSFDGFAAYLGRIDRDSPSRMPSAIRPTISPTTATTGDAAPAAPALADPAALAEAADKLRWRRLLSGPPDHAPIALIGVECEYSIEGMMSFAPMFKSMVIAAPLNSAMRFAWADRIPRSQEHAARLLSDFEAAVHAKAAKSGSPDWPLAPAKDSMPRMDALDSRWALSVELKGGYFESSGDPLDSDDSSAAAMRSLLEPLMRQLGLEARLIDHELFTLRGGSPFARSLFSGEASESGTNRLERLLLTDASLASMVEAADMKLSLGPASPSSATGTRRGKGI